MHLVNLASLVLRDIIRPSPGQVPVSIRDLRIIRQNYCLIVILSKMYFETAENRIEIIVY